MAEYMRFGASFKMDVPEQAKAWKILSAYPPRQRMAALSHMICGYQDQKEYLESIRQLMKDELQGASIFVQPQKKVESADNDALDFLLSLQKGDGFI